MTVRKVKPTLRLPRRCNFPSLDRTCPGLDIRSDLLAGWESLKKLCALPRQISFRNASDREGNANGYMQAGAHYMRQVSGLLKASVNSLRSTSLMDAPEGNYCISKIFHLLQYSLMKHSNYLLQEEIP